MNRRSIIKSDWWTKIDGRTDANGQFRARAFFGAYRLSVQAANGRMLTKEIHWQRVGTNRFEMRGG